MAVTIISPTNSFVRFDEAAESALCIWGNINYCLPVYEQSDVSFQFVIEGTELEIDSLCTQSGDEVTVSLVAECNGDDIIVFTEKPERFRLSTTQVLYNWEEGLPNFTSVISVAECFRIQVLIDATPYGYPEEVVKFCSNCFERIASDCFTSVVEYGMDEDGFGFKYCHGGNLPSGEPDTTTCEPTIVTFASVATLDIPYTALLQSKYGVFPTVQTWVYDGSGQLINMGVTVSFDTYPPTMLHFDFGGSASGIICIR
jgi:hypothetical protein